MYKVHLLVRVVHVHKGASVGEENNAPRGGRVGGGGIVLVEFPHVAVRGEDLEAEPKPIPGGRRKKDV